MLAVKLDLRHNDIGSVLDALARHRLIEIDCGASPVKTDPIEVTSRQELEERLGELFPFQPHTVPLDGNKSVAVCIVLVGGPPISGEGDGMATAIQSLLRSAHDYVDKWEHHLRYGVEHQKYWGWVYRLLLAGDDDHIAATLLNQPID